MHRRSQLGLVVAAAGMVLATLAAPGVAATTPLAGTAEPAGSAGLVVENGMTQPVYDVSAAITERVWVETDVDSDSDGSLDRVAVDVVRPDSVDGRPARYASILTASPYFDCCRDVPNHPVDLPELPQEDLFPLVPGGDDEVAGEPDAVSPQERADLAQAAADAIRDRYVARGYATVTAQTIGTADSDGCPTIGDDSEVLSVKAVIEWLTGVRTAYDVNGDEVDATWSTGDVGMMGVSYDGTLPQMVATTGVEGLQTIVPISAISSWYDYYRSNGLVVAPGGYQGEDTDVLAKFNVSDAQQATCADEIDRLAKAQGRKTGDYSRFWQKRDYVRRADGITASVFAVHGLNDTNVKLQHASQLWDKLTKLDVPRKIWLHQFGHGGPPGDTTYTLPDGSTSNFDDTVNRWMDYWLYDVDNGVLDEPRAIVQREDDHYRTYRDWPAPEAEIVRFKVAAPDAASPGTLTESQPGPRPKQRFVDAGRTRSAESLAASPDEADGNRLVYLAAPLGTPQRVSGTPTVNLRLSVDNRGDANVTALLVDYAPDGTAHVVTRGWIDPQNRDSISTSEPVVEDELMKLTFGMQPHDYVFKAGHQIGLVVLSTDYAYTIRPEPGTRLTLATRHSTLDLPLVDA